MSTDRELLELAARAVGHVWRDFGASFCILVHPEAPENGLCRVWNPLEDDGDALRLAAKLGIIVYPPSTDGGAAYCCHGDLVVIGKRQPDPAAATRCAIVGIAAEIGSLLP